jgi:hypothetical protein
LYNNIEECREELDKIDGVSHAIELDHLENTVTPATEYFMSTDETQSI